MASKNISVTLEVYSELKRRKGVSESYSTELKRLLSEKKGMISDLCGAWKTILNEKEIKKLNESAEAVRKSSSNKTVLRKLGL